MALIPSSPTTSLVLTSGTTILITIIFVLFFTPSCHSSRFSTSNNHIHGNSRSFMHDQPGSKTNNDNDVIFGGHNDNENLNKTHHQHRHNDVTHKLHTTTTTSSSTTTNDNNSKNRNNNQHRARNSKTNNNNNNNNVVNTIVVPADISITVNNSKTSIKEGCTVILHCSHHHDINSNNNDNKIFNNNRNNNNVVDVPFRNDNNINTDNNFLYDNINNNIHNINTTKKNTESNNVRNDSRNVFTNVPSKKVTWYFNGVSVKNIINKNRRMEKKGETLTIRNVNDMDTGSYFCRHDDVIITGKPQTINNNNNSSSNKSSSSSSNGISSSYNNDDNAPKNGSSVMVFHLNVQGGPRWLHEDRFHPHIQRLSGTNVRIVCASTGNPKPSTYWFKNGELIRNPPTEKNQTVLKLTNLFEYDSANYTCLARNVFGSINKTSVLEVIVQYNFFPMFKEGMYNQTVYPLDNVTLRCPIYSSMEAIIIWFKRNVNSSGSSGDAGVAASNAIGGFQNNIVDENLGTMITFMDGDSGDLTLYNVTADDHGEYICYAKNSYGHNYKSVWLNVIEREVEMQSSFWNSMIIVVVIIVVFLIVVIIVVLVNIVCFRRSRNSFKQKYHTTLVPQPGDLSRKRIVILKDNFLYGSDINSESSLLGTPQVKLEKFFFTSDSPFASGDPGKLQNFSTSSDYEIPLDKAWEFPREKLQVSSILGEGAFGTVYMATAVGVDSSNPESSTKVAVKMLKENASDQDVVDLVQEMEMMKIIGRHKNVLSLLGCCTQNGPLFVILEYAANGNLRDFLRDKRPKNFRLQNCVVEVPVETTYQNQLTEGGTEKIVPKVKKLDYLTYKDLVTFALQIAKGMEFLASKMCIHRDLAARNVLVCEDYTLKVADFGLTRNVLKSDYYKKKTDGRLPVKWMAPEALFDRKCTVKSDVWSYGILLWELFSLGGNPYPSVPVEKIFQLLKAGYRMEAPVYSSNEIYSLMLSCWHQSPDHRPSFNKIVNSLHSVLRSVENQEYFNSSSDRPASSSQQESPSSDSLYSSASSPESCYGSRI